MCQEFSEALSSEPPSGKDLLDSIELNRSIAIKGVELAEYPEHPYALICIESRDSKLGWPNLRSR